MIIKKEDYMKFEIKMFEYRGIPVYFRLWFLLLFAWMQPVTVVSLFFAVLFHEMGHAWAADRLGYRTRAIAIDLFFGSAEVEMDHCPPSDSIRIVAMGPLVNLLMFGISMMLLGAFPGTTFLASLAAVNLILFLFNILPIFPLDGGRMTKDFLMMKMRDRLAAKKAAGWISLITTSALLVFAVAGGNFILAIFCLLFGYFALKEIGLTK
jgi:Zn-dependent protease